MAATWADAVATWGDAVVTWAGAGSAPPPDGGGGSHLPRFPRRPPIRVTVEPQDDEEAALLVAILRHRFRI